ncbi:MAG: hypothetical protein AB7S80_00795 [Rhizobiaceae bacterium]
MPAGLPTQVAPYEHYMYADDRVGAPMTFFIRASLTGRFERNAFVQAVAHAQTRHPLSRAVIAGHRRARTEQLRWQPATAAPPLIIWHDHGDAFPAYPAGKPSIDIKHELGLRFFLREDGERTTLLMQVHHSVSDAIGALRFLEDVLAIYDGKVPPRALDPELLQHRHDRLAPKGMPRHPATVDEALNILNRLAEPLIAPGTPPVETEATFPASLQTTLTAARLVELRAEAAAHGTSLNDVLLRNLFVALNRFQRGRGSEHPLRILMPVDLRGNRLVEMSMANAVGMAFLDREPADLLDRDALISGIAAETRRIKQGNEAVHFNNAVEIGGRFDDGLRLICTPTRCFSTAVLSNLVRPFAGSPLLGPDGRLRAGNMVLESCALLPPLRPLTHAAFGILTYGDEARVALHYDPQALTGEDAARLLEMFVGAEA